MSGVDRSAHFLLFGKLGLSHWVSSCHVPHGVVVTVMPGFYNNFISTDIQYKKVQDYIELHWIMAG